MSVEINEREIVDDFMSTSEIGLAVLSKSELSVIYENDLFANWIPKTEEKQLNVNTFKPVKLEKFLAKGRPYSCEFEIKSQKRSRVLKLDFFNRNDHQILVTVKDYSKEKEKDYLLNSYTKIVEKNRSELERSLSLIAAQKEDLLKVNKALERERNTVELRALQAVINPHFVSNCLASIQRFVVDKKAELAVNYISNFGNLMRLSFQQSYHDYVSIEDILLTLETYVLIEKMRIDHSWELIIDIDSSIDVANSKIPPLLIQPFLENAIWHGISKKKGDGIIKINMNLIDEITLQCIVEDNGVGRMYHANKNSNKKEATLHSLNVTNKRLDILWKEHQRQYTIQYTDLFDANNSPAGTKVELLIPLSF